MYYYILQGNGVEFLVGEERMTFRGTVTFTSADNLAAYSLGGFKTLSSALRKCRNCMTVDSDMQLKVNITVHTSNASLQSNH